MAKAAYIGAPTEVPTYTMEDFTEGVTSANIGSWFSFSDPDGISSWSGATLTVAGVSTNERVKLTALFDMTVSFDYTTTSYCRVNFNGTYINDDGDDGSYTGRLPAGKSFYFYISNATSTRTGTLSNITCTKQVAVQSGTEIKSVARKIDKCYVGIPTMQSLGNMEEGSIVQINEGGSPADFYVAKHNYESGLNGEGRTLLVRKDCYDSNKWDEVGSNDLSNSDLISWLNSTYKGVLDEGIRNSLGTTKFYYTQGNNTSVAALGRSIFLLSVTELGLTNSYAKTEGSELPIASSLKTAKLDGIKSTQWTRTRYSGNTTNAFYVTTSGTLSYGQCTTLNGTRPCFTLPATTDVTNGLVTGAEAGIKEVARRIRKAYIGIGGVARPCFSGGKLAYYGTITPLSLARNGPCAATVGNHALFAGGVDTSSTSSSADVVDAYDSALTRTTPTALSLARYNHAATTIGNYALFGGGTSRSLSNPVDTVDAYNTSLTRTTPAVLSLARYSHAATTVGNYALFGGGYSSGYKNTVDAYNTSLTRTTAIALNVAREDLSATTVGNYALFAGGYGSAASSVVDAYNASLTRTTATALSEARRQLAAATLGNYALFAGGKGSAASSVVDAYNPYLTRTTATALSVARRQLAATTVCNHALFAGGCDNSLTSYGAVDAYDSTLTRTTPTALSLARYDLSATTVGDYALFGGGISSGRNDIVDAYTVA